jgi:O-antigen/teichoic acid export membrane protein
VLAPWGIRIMAGERFLPAVPLFRWMLPALVGATLSTVMASQWIGRGLFWQAAGLTVATGVLSIAIDLVMVPAHGMYGALVSTLVVYGLSIVSNLLMAAWVQRRWRAWSAARPVGAAA